MVPVRIASFDIGKKNFAFYVEETDSNLIKKLKNEYYQLPKKKQRRVKGPMCEEIIDIHHKLFKNSKTIEMGVFDIRNDKESNDLDLQTRINMFDLLEKYKEIWMSCDVILIEQQYFCISRDSKKKSGGTAANVDAIKLGEVCLSWFLMTFGTFKKIIIFGSMYKTHTLGAPDGLTKPQRKKWSVQKGEEILKLRGDTETLDKINNFKNSKGKKQKLDDVYDCLIMTQAFKFMKLIVE